MSHCNSPVEELFYGSVTVGERGQIVIPAEARRELNISAGDKLLVMKHPPSHGLLICRMDGFREFLSRFIEGLDRMENLAEEPETDADS